VEAERAGDGKRSAARRNEKRSERDSNSAERIESQVKKDEAPPKSAATPAPQIPGNFVIRDEDEIGEGGQRQKVQQNLEAIRLLKQLAQDDRRATRAEQAVLAKYVGWGGLKAAFPREDGSFAKGWEATGKELRDLLGPDEYKAAANSTQNAHYTSPEIVKAMWDAVRRLGFGGGRVLEPSVGVGNFFGLMPGEIREHAQLTGVEKDWVTGGIAKHLYPDANVQAPIGFEQFATPDGYFDLAIGNPPFGSERIFDPNRKHLKFSIHNFFFAKSLDSLRPGGLMAMVVSDSLMDAQRDNARRYLADRADLVGAVRLPNNAFEKNAGTSVTTDIVFLRKRAEGEKPAGDAWVETRTFTDAEGREMPLNEYYHAHPENVLGKLGWYGTMRPEGHSAVVAPEGQDTPALLRDFIARLPERPIEAPGVRPAEPEIEVPHEAQDAVVGSMFMDKAGKVWVRGQDLLGKPQAEPAAIEEGRALERIKGLIGIRDAFANLRKAQLDAAATDDELSRLRGDLNKVYDGFVAKNGPINLDANRRVFHDDPTWPQLSALEDKFDKGISSTVAAKTGEKPRPPSAQKAAIFTKRTQHPYQTPTSAPSAKDALAISQNELGKIDLDYMSRLYGKTPEAIIQELGPLVFKNPEAGWQSREDYLSGNVKRKLALAVEAAKADPSYQRNVEALKEVIPADLNPVDIRVAPGAHWVPPRYVEDFAAHITETDGAKAFYSPELARWVLSKLNSTPASEAKWGTQRASVTSTLEAAINGRTMTIKDRQNDGSSVVNQVATEAANEKVARIRDEWKRWLWQDDSRRDALAALYNDTFNTDQPWEPDGSHLKLPGTVDVIELRPHQKNFIWRVIQRGVALADHVVGAGKTFAVIGSIMEMRRLGLAKKPMLVVPNHLVEQWGADFMRLYPGANILAATKKDFEAENRRRLFARIATGDYDAVIVAHSSFGKIPVDLDYQRQFIESQVADMEASISALRAAEGKKSRNVAQLEKARDNLRAKLQKLLEGTGKDEIGLTFQDIGIDALAVDEAHEFKNLAFSSSMQRVAGLGNQKGSQKAADLYMKTQAVLDKTGGRNAIFATGTPVSNTMAEMFTIQRYLDNRRLSDLGLAHFDAWARQFGEIVSDWELSPSGKYKMNSRFAKFVNVPELLRQYKGFADVITREDIERQLAAQGKTLGIPKMVGGKPQNVIVDRTEHQANYIGVPIKDREGNDTEQYPEGSLIYRAEHLPKGPPKKGDDNMLKIMSDARKAALDMRLIDPNYPDPDAGRNKPVSKVGTAAVSIKRIYDQWHADKGTQLVFIDLSTPKKAREKEGARIRDLMAKAEQGDEDAQLKLDAMSPDEFDALTSEFSVYDDLRVKLLKLGIPDKEIAFIHDANTDKQKAELFGKVRSGDIRVLLGSTAKMGAGMNVQERLVALHHIDAPWRPSDLEQREGRIIRQGNSLYARDPENFEVGVYRYATKNTLDARMWQTIEGKARFIEQLRKGDLSAREIEDVGGEAANAAEMKAAASGNPLILEEMDLRQKVRKLDAARSQHDREQFDIKRTIQRDSQWATRLESELPALRKDAETIAAMGEKPTMKVGAAEFEKPKEFGDAILVRAAKMIAGGEEQANLGEIGGFPLTMSSYSVFAIMANGQRVDEQHVVIEIGAQHPEEVKIGNPKVADATGVAMKLLNTVRKMPERVAKTEQTIETTKTNVEKLRALVQPWGDQDKLEAAEQRHRDVINQLRPKKKDDAPRLINRADAEIAENGGRFNVVNKDGQRFAEHPADGFHTKAAAEDWITDQVEKNGRRESIPGRPTAGMSPDQVRAVLDNTALAEPIGKLIDAGKIVIEPTADSDANAYVTDADGVIHLVAPNLRSDGDVTASLLHEAFHSGVRPLIGDKAWSDLLGRLNSLYNQARRSTGGARAVYDKALARMAHAQETSGPYSAELTPEEFGAYVISEHETMPRAFGDWAREVIGAVKAWALRRFGRQIGAVTTHQLRTLAIAAIREQTAGTAPRLKSVESVPMGRTINSFDDIHNLLKQHDTVFVRWSPSWQDDMKPDARSKDYVSGGVHDGLSAVSISRDDDDSQIFKSLRDYSFLRAKGAKPNIYAAEIVGKDSDGAPSIVPKQHLGTLSKQFVRFLDDESNLERMRLEDDIRRGKSALAFYEKNPPDYIPIWTPEVVADKEKRLAALGGPANRPGGRRESVSAPDSEADRAMPRTVEELSDAVKALSEDQRDKALALLPLNVLPDWAAPNQVAVQQYIDTKRRMDTYRNKKQTAADEIVQRWRKAVGKGGAGAKDLADVMHQATLLGFDPARPSEGWESEPEKAALMKRYKALTPNARAVYEEVRDAYKREADERDQVILENVSKAMDQELRAAERTRDKDLASIRDEGLTGEEKKEAVKAAEDRFTRAQQKLRFSKKARLAALRAAFESNRVPEPYFPLARFGQYFVTARDDLGKVISFSRAETKMQLNRLTREIRAQLPHANIETGLLEDKGNLRSQMDPRVLADIQAILGNAGVSPEVMDQVWQRYLEAMPDLSIRKRSIHRGGVAGFNDDAMRAFASHMFHAAHQMGRVKFGGDLLELVNQATDQAKQAQNPISAQKVANELAKRHEWVMNPKNAAWANAATTLGFLYFLGASPASAAVNLSQTVIMGVPILGGRFGMGKAAAALTKASHDFVSGKGSVETSKNLTEQEKTAITDLYERGALDKSMAHDLAGVADRGAGYNPTRQRVMQAMAFLFHHAERFNREVTALAAYRLARQAGLSHGAAVDKAGELTWLTHFDYSNTNRPRVMQNDAAKVALLFKNFQINMIYRVFRDTQQAFAGDTPQARKEARYQLAGIVGMYALMAGGLGVPLMKQIIIPLWKMLFGNEPDKSGEEEFRDAVLKTLGPQLGGAALDGVPGYLTGTSLTQRIGMGDLWFQSQDRVQTAQDWWNSLANDMLGPVWGMAHNVYNGFNVIRDGKGVARGVEMAMPTAAKNLMRAWRYSQEGVVNLRGDTVVPQESLGLRDALKQALGFTPAQVAEQYTRNDEKANMDKRIGQQRKQLLDAYAKAHKAEDDAAVASALADIRRFNAEPNHAAKRITGETIRDSIRTRARLSNRAENGIIIQNRRQNTLLNERLPPRVY
jgi:N12 class adenine-specific DNA methylase